VFTAFSMAGFGMAKYHHKHKEPGWRHKLVINFSAGVLTSIVVLIFAVVKFTEGAWLILIIFPVGVFALIRLNREYSTEVRVLANIGVRRASGVVPNQPNYSRRVVIVFVDDFDLSTLAALRYAKSLRPTTVRAVHFVIDSEKAEKLRVAWLPDRSVSLEFIDCPDRRLTRCAAELVGREAEHPGTQVTAILPRRNFSLRATLLHDRTADKIAGVVSRVPNAAATIIPFDVQNRVRVLAERQAESEGTRPVALTPAPGPPAARHTPPTHHGPAGPSTTRRRRCDASPPPARARPARPRTATPGWGPPPTGQTRTGRPAPPPPAVPRRPLPPGAAPSPAQ